MDPLTISVASGLRSRMESLDLLANNLANSGTSGYKKDIESYSLYMSDAAIDQGASDDPAVAVLPVVDHQWTDFTQGGLQETGNQLDVALNGAGLLAVDGPNGTAYTRSGRLRIASGQLETMDGYPVRLVGGGHATVDSSLPLAISTTGQITQGAQFIGQLEVVTFNDSATLTKVRGTYFETAQTPQASTAEVLQGRLEGSNVNTAESSVRLINVMRQFEMLSKAAGISSDMNRLAVEQVAKVGA